MMILNREGMGPAVRCAVLGGMVAVAMLVPAGVAGVAGVAGQSVLERPPNMHGGWSGRSGMLYFNVMHRFTATGPPARKVVNFPMLLFGGGVVDGVLVGARYSTNSELVSGIPNEWEFFGRYTPFRGGALPVTPSVQLGYNHAAASVDAELSLERELGPVRLLGAGRVFSDAYGTGESRFAVSAGAALRLMEYVAVAGDYARLVDLDPAEGEAAWSAGIQLAIPYTPHTLSLQVGNTSTTTLQGSSIGFTRPRWGFEFTAPIRLSRYFGTGGPASAASAPAAEAGEASPSAADTVAAEVGMTNRLEFTPDTVRIQVGETVRWRNSSDVLHTVTADPEQAVQSSSVLLPEGAVVFDSGDMAPGDTFEYTFDVPGEYRYFCVPHELAGMVGTVIVTGDSL